MFNHLLLSLIPPVVRHCQVSHAIQSNSINASLLSYNELSISELGYSASTYWIHSLDIWECDGKQRPNESAVNNWSTEYSHFESVAVVTKHRLCSLFVESIPLNFVIPYVCHYSLKVWDPISRFVSMACQKFLFGFSFCTPFHAFAHDPFLNIFHSCDKDPRSRHALVSVGMRWASSPWVFFYRNLNWIFTWNFEPKMLSFVISTSKTTCYDERALSC